MNELTQFIQQKRQQRPLLLMTHVVYGYPSVEESLQVMQLLLEKGVELLEVQFPFSDPVADGPTITTACHQALENSPKLTQCLEDIKQLARKYPDSRVLLMSYLNPLLQKGFARLAEDMGRELTGIIIPDITIDHQAMLKPLEENSVSPVWLITPDMQAGRIKKITDVAQGMLYCVSRAGVTGQQGATQQNMQRYLAEIRQYTELPLAVGFGITSAADISVLTGHADVAIVGSALLNAFNTGGLEGVSSKLDELRPVNVLQ